MPVFRGAGGRNDWGDLRDCMVRETRRGWSRCGQLSRRGRMINQGISPWPTPNRLWLAAGAAEGTTELNAFDNALLDGGIGNLNLIKVSSIVPQGAEFLQVPPVIAPGSLVPTVYSVMHSDTAGETICAALGIGIGRESHGMIFEYHANSREVAERVVTGMVEEGFSRRGLPLERVTVTLAEHRVERLGCAVAAVVLWWG